MAVALAEPHWYSRRGYGGGRSRGGVWCPQVGPLAGRDPRCPPPVVATPEASPEAEAMGFLYRRKREAVAEAKPESDADPKDFYLFPTLM